MLFSLKFNSCMSPLDAEKPVMPDCTNAIRLDADFDMAEYEDLQNEITENLLKLAEKSKLIGMIMENSGI